MTCIEAVWRDILSIARRITWKRPPISGVRCLEALGARRIEKIETWVVMEAPTGQRFCVINRGHKYFDETANRWE